MGKRQNKKREDDIVINAAVRHRALCHALQLGCCPLALLSINVCIPLSISRCKIRRPCSSNRHTARHILSPMTCRPIISVILRAGSYDAQVKCKNGTGGLKAKVDKELGPWVAPSLGLGLGLSLSLREAVWGRRRGQGGAGRCWHRQVILIRQVEECVRACASVCRPTCASPFSSP